MVGNLTELMGDLDGAIVAYEQALRHNQFSIPAMNAISCILRTKENFPKAVEYLQAIVKLEANNGEVWGSLGMSSRYGHLLYCTKFGERTLLFDDGGPATGLFSLPTSLILPERPEGMKSSLQKRNGS